MPLLSLMHGGLLRYGKTAERAQVIDCSGKATRAADVDLLIVLFGVSLLFYITDQFTLDLFQG